MAKWYYQQSKTKQWKEVQPESWIKVEWVEGKLVETEVPRSVEEWVSRLRGIGVPIRSEEEMQSGI
jgi:hypothetical protein